MRPGVVALYGDWLPSGITNWPVTLGEGGTPLVDAPELSQRSGCDIYLKLENLNPTATFKDRGMAVAVSGALASRTSILLCASVGSTAASAAAYAARAGLRCAVLTPANSSPELGMLQAMMHGAIVLRVIGGLDDCHALVRAIGSRFPVTVANSSNHDRIEGQKTVAFEIVDAMGDAPDVHCLPLDNFANMTACMLGYAQYQKVGRASLVPLVAGFTTMSKSRPTVASGHYVGEVTPEQTQDVISLLAKSEAIFADSSSATAVAGMLQECKSGRFAKGSRIVCTISGGWAGDVSAAAPSKHIEVHDNNICNIAKTLGIH